MDGAVNAVASVARTVLLALPTSDVSAFEPVGGLVFPVRLTDGALPGGLPPRFRAIDVGGASSVVRETRILSETKAQAVVMRANGAPTDSALVTAARRLDLPIVMIRRPQDRGVRPARSIEAVLEWLTLKTKLVETMDQPSLNRTSD